MSTNGDVPKWLKGADSKSARRRKACGGSNPSISANGQHLVPGWIFARNPVLYNTELDSFIAWVHEFWLPERGGGLKA